MNDGAGLRSATAFRSAEHARSAVIGIGDRIAEDPDGVAALDRAEVELCLNSTAPPTLLRAPLGILPKKVNPSKMAI